MRYPDGVARMLHRLDLSDSADPILREWQAGVERWEREKCAQVADACAKTAERAGEWAHECGAQVVAAQIRRRR